jgi:hypothetical protein
MSPELNSTSPHPGPLPAQSQGRGHLRVEQQGLSAPAPAIAGHVKSPDHPLEFFHSDLSRQFSTDSPAIRLNSRSLFVASMTSKAIACAPIQRSLFPIKRPSHLVSEAPRLADLES